MKQFLGDLKNHTPVSSYFALVDKKSLRPYKSKPGLWFEVMLSDKTGQMAAKFWGGNNNVITQKLFDSLSTGSVVNVRGTTSQFQNILSINVDDIHMITEYDKDDLILISDIDIGQLKLKLVTEIESMRNGSIKLLLNSLFKDEIFFEKFTRWPAAQSYHHAYLGGLLEHVLNMVNTSKVICQNYPSIDADMVKAGCILHDIGKVAQYDMDVGITHTLDGDYMGHIGLGIIMVQEKIKQLRDIGVSFDTDLERQILHIILSHHGKKEFGSPITPQTPEAWAVHLVDMCDAHLNHAVKRPGVMK